MSSLTHGAITLASDPKLHYHVLGSLGSLFLLETVFVMYRRTMFGAIRDPRAVVVAVVITALEEAFARSTMVYRDTFLAKILGRPELSGAELTVQRKIWACSAAMGMYIEVTSIITCRVMYLAFRPHRL